MDSKKGACSSHTQSAKGNCLQHARREGRIPSYVNPHLSGSNRTVFESDDIRGRKSILPFVHRAEKLYTEKTGQKVQKSFTPFRESCLVLRDGVTDKQLLDFKESAEKLTGWKCVGIWLHQDEGHYNSKYIEGDESFAINYHAHVLWDCQDHVTGKAVRCDRKKLSTMQDLLAKATGMKRGNYAKDTGKKGRSAREQRIAAQEQRIAALDVSKARKEAAVATAKAVGEAIKGLVGQSSKDKEIKALKAFIAGEPERTAAAVATAKAEERQQVLSEVKKAANLCIKEKNGRETAEDIGKAWRRRFREVSELESNLKSIRANMKTQIESATDEYRRRAERAEERAELWKDRFLDVWPTAEKAIAAIVEKVNNNWQRFFTIQQVKDIDAAMKSAVDTEDRIERGKQLMEYARPEFTKCELNTAEQVEDIAINRSNVRTQSIGRSI